MLYKSKMGFVSGKKQFKWFICNKLCYGMSEKPTIIRFIRSLGQLPLNCCHLVAL